MGTRDLDTIAREMRCDIISMIGEAGSGHPGGSLSAVDIMTALFFGGIMDYDRLDPKNPARDRFILSKGHAAPVLYATLAQAGYLPCEELLTLRKFGSRLQGHPDSKKLACVEVSTGSLGQGLSIGCGYAYALTEDGSNSTVFVLLGDGEIQEGQVWEAAMFAAHYKLGNLVAILDNNSLQIDGKNSEVMDLGDIPSKFRAFGWQVSEVDGHDIGALRVALKDAKEQTDGPHIVIAHTVKGKGVPFMEDQAGWHGKAPNAQQCVEALAALEQEGE